MAEARSTASQDQDSQRLSETVTDATNKLADTVSRTASAGTEAITEVAVGTLEVAADLATGVARSFADNLNNTVRRSTRVAQRGVERFFDTLDGVGSTDSKRSASKKTD